MSPTRLRHTALAAAISTSLFGVACGGSDEGERAAIPDIDTVSNCLTNAGFEVTREVDQDPANVLPAEFKESVGLIESVALGSIDESVGIGSVAFYESADAAEDDFEAAAGFRTDDVLAGVTGTVTWSYLVTSGDDSGVEVTINACLS